LKRLKGGSDEVEECPLGLGTKENKERDSGQYILLFT